ncbi:MAG: NRDE family protein [Planctomycetota bacterium]
MCTLSSIPGRHGPRLVMNRDEQRSREPGLPPTQVQRGPWRCCMPRDPVGGGSWIAVNEPGLALALLNRNDESVAPPPPQQAPSRGLLVDELCGLPDRGAVRIALQLRDLGPFHPFILVVVAEDGIGSCAWDGRRVQWQEQDPAEPQLWCSSGLGDALVDAPRRTRFADLVLPAPGPASQDRFHADRGSGDGATDVLMTRADARSVSRSVVTWQEHRLLLEHVALDEDGVASEATRCELERVRL